MSSKRNAPETDELAVRKVFIKVRDLSIRDQSHILDLSRFLQEKLAGILIREDGDTLEITAPASMSKRIIRLRIRKFLYKNNLNDDFRPISYLDDEKDGYEIHEKKKVGLTYY